MERVGKGTYILIPLGSEKGRYTLNEFVIGSMLVKPAVIAYWSALHHWGFTEQIPRTVFIQTTARTTPGMKTALGLEYKDLKGLSPEDQFKTIADRLSRVADPTTRAAVAIP